MISVLDPVDKLQSDLDKHSTFPGRRKTPISVCRAFGEQVQAIVEWETARNSGVSYSKLSEIQKRAAAGGSEAVPADGGFLVFQQFADAIWPAVIEDSPILSRCRQYPITQDNASSLKIPGYDEQSRAAGSRWGGILSYWENEAVTAASSKPKYRLIDIELKKLLAFKYITNELLQDAALLGVALEDAYYQELRFKVELASLVGDGAGKPMGILSGGNKALITVAKVNNQTNATIVGQNIQDMWARMPGNRRSRAIWLVNQDAENQFDALASSADVSSSIFSYSVDPDNQPFPLLKGRPAVAVEYLPALGTLGDILLVDLLEYIVCTKGGIDGEVSAHVNWTTDESVLRLRLRVDAQPTMHAPVLQYNGTQTQSAYVTLAAR